MSQVSENSTLPGLTAGNTASNLAGVDRDVAIYTTGIAGSPVVPSAADLDAVAQEQVAKDATSALSTHDFADGTELGDPFDNENTFDVSRAEFTELQDAFLRLAAGVARYNQTAPHKILGV